MLPLFFIRNKLLADRAKLGSWGERYCERYLKRKGFQCIARNFSVNTAEIDIIMTSGDKLVFVEVKTRASENFQPAQKAVNSTKQQKIAFAARIFMKKYNLTNHSYRFDVVAIVLPPTGKVQIRHYENAFSG